MPTEEEWEAIVDSDCSDDPEIVGNGTGSVGCYSDNGWASGVVVASFYWSSTTYSPLTSLAWFANLNDGHVFSLIKTNPYYVWPVRGGH